MKKVFVIFLAFFAISCLTDDADIPITEENVISFTLNGTAYVLTEFNVYLDPLDSEMRIVEAVFDNDAKRIQFFVIVEETNEIEEFILYENDVSWISAFGLGYRNTSITTHTDSAMEGTFTIVMEDRNGVPGNVFTNGIINIQY
ncbi:MAG: hypothetical protein AAF617_05070 [Bacteroidota bacterium]